MSHKKHMKVSITEFERVGVLKFARWQIRHTQNTLYISFFRHRRI